MTAVIPDAVIWQALSACRGEDLELFFGPDGDESPKGKTAREAIAKEVCARCPVLTDCLGHAIDGNVKHGVWGGMGEDERATHRQLVLRRRRTGKA